MHGLHMMQFRKYIIQIVAEKATLERKAYKYFVQHIHVDSQLTVCK